MRIKGLGSLAKAGTYIKAIKKAGKITDNAKMDFKKFSFWYEKRKDKPNKYKLGFLAGIKWFCKKEVQDYIDSEMRRIAKEIKDNKEKVDEEKLKMYEHMRIGDLNFIKKHKAEFEEELKTVTGEMDEK